jgi:hypothetical protein
VPAIKKQSSKYTDFGQFVHWLAYVKAHNRRVLEEEKFSPVEISHLAQDDLLGRDLGV